MEAHVHSTSLGAGSGVRSLREACLHCSDEHREKDSLSSGVAGTQIRHEIRSAFVRKACYRLALLLGSLAASLDRRGRRVALSNLRVAFGDEISAERRGQIVRESYQHFARTMLDFFWSPRLTSQNFSRYVEFENRERWDEENTRPGKPVIVGCYHYSNFEWLSIVSAFAGLEGVVIAQQFKNPLLDPIFLEVASEKRP